MPKTLLIFSKCSFSEFIQSCVSRSLQNVDNPRPWFCLSFHGLTNVLTDDYEFMLIVLMWSHICHHSSESSVYLCFLWEEVEEEISASCCNLLFPSSWSKKSAQSAAVLFDKIKKSILCPWAQTSCFLVGNYTSPVLFYFLFLFRIRMRATYHYIKKKRIKSLQHRYEGKLANPRALEASYSNNRTTCSRQVS